MRWSQRIRKTAQYLGAKNLFLMSDIMKEDRSVLETDYVITKEEKMEATLEILKALVPIVRKKAELHL